MFVVKRNGEKARLDRTKISNWVQWSARGLEDQIEIEHELLSDLVPLLTEGITTEDIHQMLITACLAKEDIRYSRIAANLEAATIMKSRKHKLGIFETDSFSEILDVMVSEGLWSGDWVTSLTDIDLRRLDTWYIELSAVELEYWTVKQWSDKYAVKLDQQAVEDVASGAIGIACSLHGVTDIALSVARDIVHGRLNLPTPMLNGGRNGDFDTVSCCVIEAGDTVDSIDAAEYVASRMTAKKAGIGIMLNTRAKGDDVKGGSVEHLGKWPLAKSIETSVKKYTQLSRGGSATLAVRANDPEIMNILLWKTQRIDHSQRIDKVDYNFVYNDDFMRAVMNNEDWYLFSIYEAPEVHENFHRVDYMDFVKAAIRSGAKYTKVNALDLILEYINSRTETSRFYDMNATRSNQHTPFIDPIKQSNLCMEIQLATKPYTSMYDLIAKPVSDGEVAFCALAAINVASVTAEQYMDLAYTTVRTVHEMVSSASTYCISDSMRHNLLRRKSLGIGITGLAGWLYEQGLDYDGSPESIEAVNQLAELHAYSLYKASQRMVEEGLAPAVAGIDENWLPIDTMMGDYEPALDWETLRGKPRAHTVLVAHMPTESSAAFSGATNGVYPTRDRVVYKKARTGKVQFISEHFDETKLPAWEVNMAPYYQAIQDWTDQAISADDYVDFTKYPNRKIPAEVLLERMLDRWHKGIKTAYYQNNRVSTKEMLDQEESDCTSCKL